MYIFTATKIPGDFFQCYTFGAFVKSNAKSKVFVSKTKVPTIIIIFRGHKFSCCIIRS